MSDPTNLVIRSARVSFGGSSNNSEVARWLSSHGMQEWIDPLSKQGYDDIEDLRQLCNREIDTFESIITKPGHRKKIQRLLNTPSESGRPENNQNARPVNSSSEHSASLPSQPTGASPTTASSPASQAPTAPRNSLKPSSPPVPTSPVIEPMPMSPRDGTESDILLKIIVVGDTSSGKTSFIRQLVEGRFTPNIKSTVGLDFNEKRFIAKDTAITVQFWDISGQERFASMTRAYYKGANGAMVCYDVTRPKSFEMVAKWKQDIEEKVFLNESTLAPIPAILLGNKCDCDKKVEKSNVELAKYCIEKNFVGWFETSAKTGYNVREAAEFLVSHSLKEMKENSGKEQCLPAVTKVVTTVQGSPTPNENNPVKLHKKSKQDKGCC